MFEKIKNIFKKESTPFILASPMEGKVIDISEVNDITFSEKLVGDGVAIIPTGGKVVSPIDGVIGMIFETGHAVGVKGISGLEVLIHIGLDTVELKGEHFTIHTKKDNTVKKGDLLIEFDKEAIKKAGYDTTTPVVITNHKNYGSLEKKLEMDVKELDALITIHEKNN